MADENNQNVQNNQPNNIWYYAKRAILIWVVSRSVLGPNGLINKFTGIDLSGGKVQPPPSTAPVDTPSSSLIPTQVTNLWDKNTVMDLYIKLSTSDNPYTALYDNNNLPEVHWSGIEYGDWSVDRSASFDVDIPHSVTHHNGTLWADFYLSKQNAIIDHTDPSYDPLQVTHSRKLLTRLHPKPKQRREVNLLGGDDEAEEVVDNTSSDHQLVVPYWHSNLTLSLVQDTNINVPYTQTQPAARKYIPLDPLNSRKDGASPPTGYHYPILYPNDFWLLRNQFTEVNSTTTTLPLHISLSSLILQIQHLCQYSRRDGTERTGAGHRQ